MIFMEAKAILVNIFGQTISNARITVALLCIPSALTGFKAGYWILNVNVLNFRFSMSLLLLRIILGQTQDSNGTPQIGVA